MDALGVKLNSSSTTTTRLPKKQFFFISMKEELSQTIDRLYKQENFKTLLSKLVSWILSEELEITVMRIIHKII